MTGIEMIAAERQRQIEVEGWTAEHDRQHTGGEIALAGAVYALWNALDETTHGEPHAELMAKLWPWDPEWLKPKGRLRNLTRAGALMAAEIDRILAEEATP